ncbi:hypothetical protein ACLI09_07080 [Flavobacterium sp. RHBU_24]|uniref:hypothetical protein n=1 Tax=Flavobacterium sp. RHBU_24 TaxID=3391185 RepID=UPI0039848FC9
MKYLALIVVLLFLARPVVPVAEYIINYDYIANVLCVNKAKPQMHCNGKCHLMKELAKTSGQENPVSSGKKAGHATPEVLFFQPLQSLALTAPVKVVSPKQLPVYNCLYSRLCTGTVFHPPAVIS